MLRHTFTAFVFSAGMLLGTAAYAADPAIQQVYAAAKSGHLDQAQQMMQQVLRDHPDSGKAHFVEAELLAKQGDLSGARKELGAAERLEPGLPFAKPAAVEELKSLLAKEVPADTASGAASYASAPARASFPVGLLAVLLFGGCIVAYFMRRRSQALIMQSSASGSAFGYGSGYQSGSTYYGNAPAPSAPSSSSAPSSGGLGSGIVGGLATGAAMGAGIAAGEGLMHRVLDSGHHTTTQPLSTPTPAPSGNWADMQPGASSYDMGGSEFGLNDDTSWDDGSSNTSTDDW
jgi:hypothetical protein